MILNSGGEKKDWLQRLMRGWLAPPPGQDWVLEAEWSRIMQTPVKARGLLYLVSLVLFLLVVWSYFAEIDEVAKGDGKVIPSQQLQVLQSYDGGIVQDILVREGQTVEAGQVLLKVDPTRFLSSLEENTTQFAALAAKVQRLSALTQGDVLRFNRELREQAPTIVDNERKLYNSNLAELDEVAAGSDSRIMQRRQDVEEERANLSQYQNVLSLSKKELSVTKPLLASGAVSEIEILRLERQIVELEGNITKSKVAIERGLNAIEEEIIKKEEARLKLVNRWNQELTEATAEMATLQQSQTSLEDVVSQAALRSPINGTVQRLLINTIGGVITPGSAVVELVPQDDQLIVEAKVSPKDIAFIREGQQAILKFSAYDFTIYGGMSAEVRHISADAITNEKDETYYLVRLETKKSIADEALDILPGMIVQVDILTGKKTVLNYILSPLFNVTASALRER
ncbi:HlyD family type I secretion periplasmic adaptor subunit [Alteromonas macleodii]|jgi:adhesin transport system membrane fusion protein|uniref:HlyD family type I secretion periplasmic adaptor subunit n=1 Tax=Alteromonas TaxID=226 RepID=UPI00057E84B3|nr:MULTISPECIES: HlyD family type I secretion periplasmic adaptor subunit [Alteromonas]MCH2257795.1 HlyD family type I secretion periplasmic adaptor subunit [Alteromonas sp.]KHT57208.1 secretion protein HylD [Alteromonas macleodii]MCG7652137.1 HlyD family type I secretion periplasmic adaptor subunit [Alteromonas sp. Cnat2-8]OLF78714.1 secretion protein HylD [Alteromonas sp. W12]PXW76609.1 adhesin transport system membrane fusion protein [Alteromonas sp. I10]|tara:strand:+ start:198 stop:1565 length:1368 start_codon:yes stop_codon:yes gene_type:complete